MSVGASQTSLWFVVSMLKLCALHVSDAKSIFCIKKSTWCIYDDHLLFPTSCHTHVVAN